MCKPVIIDDGGSLRIRELKDNVTMDGLMDPPAAPVPSNENFADTGAFVCTLTVRYSDEFGIFTTVPLVGTLYGLPLAVGDTITITSNKHTAAITFPGNVLSILLSAGASASQEGPRRRYVISNFGKIQTVTSALSGVIFPAPGSNPPARSYTMVHFSPGPPTDQITRVEKIVPPEKKHEHKGS